MQKQIQTIHQKQSLTMTSTMHQSLSILQMSNMELANFAAQELGKNPFIEDDKITTEVVRNKNADKPNLSSSNNSYSNSYSSQDFLSNIASEKSLKEHITEQIELSFDDYKEKIIAYFLLDSLQNSGYLKISTGQAADILKCDEEIVCDVLKIMQSFDPAGVFARDLKECLLIQLSDQENVDQSLLMMVQNIDLIANGDYKKLSKLCKVDIGNIGSLVKQIKLLNPKPTNGFFVEQTSFKIPDVVLTFDDRGIAKLETNPESVPRLRINNEYYAIVKNNIHNDNEKNFVKSEIEAANAIIKSIQHRNNTILRIAGAIVEEQIDFFTKGVMYFKPLTLNTIAAKTEFNESTVSRSTANKYIATPSGIFELKYFFSSSINTARSSSDNISSTKVKEIIKQIIASEDPNNILSDDNIVEQLTKFNISIARRTVAKYREFLKIPTSSARKRALQVNCVV
ncbi:MAG: RNA polymerase sigma-54 factor [Rickettsiales bacterium]|nr:MAG: RNA polymerase sigma-54 factor [Rickettsiales bacterium]